MSLDRRRFLLASGLAAAPLACRSGGAPPAAGAPAKPAAAPAAPPVAGAEQILGVELTEKERELAAGTLEQQLDMVRARRALTLPSDLAPALTFDPVLPGAQLVPVRGGVRWSRRAAAARPASEEDIAFAPLAQLHDWLRRRVISSAELTDLYLARLERHGPALECVVTLTADLARAQAREADGELRRGRVRGPLHGVPCGLKDLFDTAGVATTFGAAPFRGRVPERDAAVVARLREAGAVIAAKLTLGELAMGDIWFGGRTRNPWNREEGSSGSSAGSAAAVAAGLVGFALGTETLGSIVSPSCRCGTTGLRPTFGRVPRTGAMPLCWSLDKIGPITRGVEDAAMVLAAIHGAHAGDPVARTRPLGFDARRGAKGRRIGFSPAWFDGPDATDADRNALGALGRLGAELVQIELPSTPFGALIPILLAEAAAAFEDLTLDGRDDQLAWQDADGWPNTFRAARFLSAVDIIQADRLRRRVMHEMDRLFAGVDAILSPPNSDLLVATNFTGHPSLTLRAGFTDRRTRTSYGDDSERKDGPTHTVPRCVILWGHLYDEGRLCEIGADLERALAVADRRPPL